MKKFSCKYDLLKVWKITYWTDLHKMLKISSFYTFQISWQWRIVCWCVCDSKPIINHQRIFEVRCLYCSQFRENTAFSILYYSTRLTRISVMESYCRFRHDYKYSFDVHNTLYILNIYTKNWTNLIVLL